MKVLYYDVFCGISGDMNLGALVDLGVDLDYLKNELKKLNINDEFDIKVEGKMKHGISGTKLDVILHNQEEGHTHSHEDNQEHNHEHSHEHDHGHNQGHTHSHNRNFKMIREMIMSSDFNDKVKEISVEIFRVIAEAEGKVHNKPIDEVHFHEVGATDSIIDIVGAAICLDYLKVDKVMSSSVQVGGGFVKCAHGRMPVPAPATAEILKDVPMKYNVVPFETTTPTGAAILKVTVDEYIDLHNVKIDKIGYGLGTKDFEIPNILRVYLGSIEDQETDLIHETQYIGELNIDDMNPELYSYIEGKLFEAGALDVYKTPIQMKKNRPGTKLSVLYTDQIRSAIFDIIFRETSSAGLREYPVNKFMLVRDFELVSTIFGDVKVKNLYYKGELVKRKPEYDDCARLAELHQVSIHKIYQEVNNNGE